MSLPNRLPVPPTTTTVASFRTREAASEAASKLIRAGVEPKAITITGSGLRSIERVMGKFTVITALRNGAMNGLFFGLVLASFSLLLNPEAPPVAFLGMMLVGLASGVLLGLISFALVRRKKDFQSATQVVADAYELGVTAQLVQQARTALGVAAPTTRPEVDLTEPPRYGERIEKPAAD